MTYPTVDAAAVPWLTVQQMVDADRLAVEDFGIGLLQMMEHAGRSLADLTIELFPEGDIVVLAGGGNNGGGGLSAARHLANRGRRVAVALATADPGPAVTHHLRTLAAMGIRPLPELPPSPVVVDALVGYGLAGALRGRAASLAAAAGGRSVVSLDLPSGHGAAGAVEAAATLTLALPKEGLRRVRPLYVADLGLPDALWTTLGVAAPGLFRNGRIVRVV